ncbi:lysogenic conversion protein [Citrobacter braakii]|nr:lysogenic conversion protein [Citrobacter braakii]MDU2859006.1 hypothetical protein [Streptococcus salivarius]
MTDPFSWENWRKVYTHKKNKKRASLERYGLRNLHSVASLDMIVSKVNDLYLENNQEVFVNASSVWIDGTPQARFTTIDGSILNCELADLLFIVHEVDERKKTKNFRAVLLQGKCSEKHDLLPNGISTEKERKLLESIDRDKYLTLYPGTRAYGESIGEYKLGGDVIGLTDCAKFLMMPKNERWNYKVPDRVSPYVIGWPENLSSKHLIKTKNYLNSILRGMIVSKDIGKLIKLLDEQNIDRRCEWSRMICDLLNNYLPVTMKGYNCQRRVYKSSSFDDNMLETLALIKNEYCDALSKHECGQIPSDKERFHQQLGLNLLCNYSGPVVSTIFIQIKQKEGEVTC